jgi:arylsulfatase
MVPTVLDAIGVEPPTSIKGVTQSPVEGHSFAHTFESAEAPSKHTTQYFEMMGHRSLYHDGWKAVCPWPGPSFTEAGAFFGIPIPYEKLTELDATGWELYHVAEDVAENHDIAAENRDKLIEMIAQWYVEAGKYNVLPVDGRGTMRLMEERPQIAVDRSKYVYYPGTQTIPHASAANVLNRPHSITLDVDFKSGDEGVLISQGGNDAGYALWIKDDKLFYVHNYVGRAFYYVESSEAVPEGRHELRYEFEMTGPPDIAKGKGAPGKGQLYFDGKLVGQGEIPVTTPLTLGLTGGIYIGGDPGSPVAPDYEPPFHFTGELHSATVDVSGELIEDDELTLRRYLASQ